MNPANLLYPLVAIAFGTLAIAVYILAICIKSLARELSAISSQLLVDRAARERGPIGANAILAAQKLAGIAGQPIEKPKKEKKTTDKPFIGPQIPRVPTLTITQGLRGMTGGSE